MKAILKAAFKNQMIVSLCTGKVNWDKRILGYVTAINNDRIIIAVVDIFGSVVKSKSIAITNIAVAETNDSYNKHLAKLKAHAKSIKNTKSLYYYNYGDNFREKLEVLRSEDCICTIFFGTQYMTGVIHKFDKSILVVKGIGFRGTKEGQSYCKLRAITKIRYQGPLEKKIHYLRKFKSVSRLTR